MYANILFFHFIILHPLHLPFFPVRESSYNHSYRQKATKSLGYRQNLREKSKYLLFTMIAISQIASQMYIF